jgi:polysaccharide biosynthesis protein PelF
MRIALLTAGGYPYRRDPFGTWCRHLVGGLDRHTFHLLTLTDRARDEPAAYPLPRHVLSARAVPIVAPGRPTTATRRDDEATAAALLILRGVLGDGPDGDAMFAAGLRRLAIVGGRAAEPMSAVPVVEVLLDAWRASRAADAGRHRLPRLSLRDAHHAAALLRRASRALAVHLPTSDVVHCVGATASLLTGLANRWRTGTPLLLTEARTPIHARSWESHLPPGVRVLLRRFRRAVARAGYTHAGALAAVSGYHRDWMLHHGADPSRIVTVPAVADPRQIPALPESSGRPSLLCDGVEPGVRLDLLLEAFRGVLAAVPDAVLTLVGTHRGAAQLRVHRELAHRAGLGPAVRVSAPPVDRRPLYAASQVVVHLPGPAEPPHRLVEAMMSGRAVVGVDAGPVAETLGRAGVVVPIDDPAALAGACARLLDNPADRSRLAADARRRALANFTPDRLVRAYDALYEDVAAPPVVSLPRHEFQLAIAAPRTPVPSTIGWLAREAR